MRHGVYPTRHASTELENEAMTHYTTSDTMVSWTGHDINAEVMREGLGKAVAYIWGTIEGPPAGSPPAQAIAGIAADMLLLALDMAEVPATDIRAAIVALGEHFEF